MERPDLAKALVAVADYNGIIMRRLIPQLVAYIEWLEDDTTVAVDRLWLMEVAADMEGWGAYASDYFKEKWDLAGDVAKVRAMAEGKS